MSEYSPFRGDSNSIETGFFDSNPILYDDILRLERMAAAADADMAAIAYYFMHFLDRIHSYRNWDDYERFLYVSRAFSDQCFNVTAFFCATQFIGRQLETLSSRFESGRRRQETHAWHALVSIASVDATVGALGDRH